MGVANSVSNRPQAWLFCCIQSLSEGLNRGPRPPPYTKARIVSGPFFLAVSLGKRAEVLRVTLGQNTLISLFSAPEPSLFSVWPAGRLRRGANKINNLHAPVRCQPRRAIRLQTREHSLVSRDQHNTIQTAFSHKLSINRIVAKRLLTNQPLKPES